MFARTGEESERSRKKCGLDAAFPAPFGHLAHKTSIATEGFAPDLPRPSSPKATFKMGNYLGF